MTPEPVTTITTLLIANRGEIARRIMRSAASMGMRTVAVYADGDVDAPFVREADDAVALGGTTAAETYLDGAKVLDAARRTGANAVHPGYGFLSENAGFAQDVLDAGLVWVGPPPRAIAAMGDKLAAKELMSGAGVPVLASVELAEGTDLAAAGDAIGFPALVKAAAGGGGKGMRVVDRAADLREAVEAARREAQAAFGDGAVFLERYLTGARHVEVQILGDRHGKVVHLFERECSIQRRHQKVVEEAPSSAVDDALRSRMGEAALAAAKTIGYENAGTVEFLLADDGSFFFLEVNTRLQVEHPVTEMITGLDLVREQLLVAQGFALGWGQEDLSVTGHAIEARLYAEDPERDFLPVTGTVAVWEPAEYPVVRFDSGIESGSVVGVDFDPLLAKVIAHAPTRREAAQRLALALERTRIHGTTTNRDFLVAVLRHPRFLAGDTTTDFIAAAAPARRRAISTEERQDAAIAVVVVAAARRRGAAPVLATLPSGWRNSAMPPERVTLHCGEEAISVAYRRRTDDTIEFAIGTDTAVVRVLDVTEDEVDVAVGDRRVRATVRNDGRRWWVHGPMGDVELLEMPRFADPELEKITGGLSAPLPGRVVSTGVAVGDRVVEGQLLVIVEAMKMEHRVVAPHPGVVSELRVAAGQQVSSGDVLVVIDEDVVA